MSNDTGSGQDGTVVNKAFVDDLLDEVDDQCHSLTNDTIKPKATTDEVVTARGSLGSLDARLDVSLNNDGTLKEQASLTTVVQARTFVASVNCIENGELEDWTNGGAAAPDSFTLSSLTIARTGPAMGDTFTFGAGTYAAKLTRAGGIDGYLYQDVIPAADWAKSESIEGKKVSVLMMARSAIANHVRVTIDDGAGSTSSAFLTVVGGAPTTEVLTATHTILGSASRLRIKAEVMNSNGDAYVGGFLVIFSDLAPSHWVPKSLPPLATALRPGLMGIGAQEFEGIKTLKKRPIVNDGTFNTRIPLTLHVNITPVGNVGAGPDDLMSYAIPANFFDADGRRAIVRMLLKTAANANAKDFRIYVAGNIVNTLGNHATGAEEVIEVTVYLIRTSSTNLRVYCFDRGSGATNPTVRNNYNPGFGGTITVKADVTNTTADNDGVQEMLEVVSPE